MYIVIIWLIIRLVTLLVALWFSSLQPNTIIEQTVPIWPVSGLLNIWIERIFLSPWLRWDAEWYLKIIVQGYDAIDGTAQFHPLYPWLASLLFKAGFHPLFGLLLISSISSLFLLLFFYKLSRLDFNPKEAFTGLSLLLFFPTAFILFAPYTESTFLLFAVLSIYFSRKHSWFLAGLTGGLAALTRQQGIFLIMPLLIEFWEDMKQGHYTLRETIKYGIMIGLVPAGLISWMMYRAIVLFDLQPKMENFNTLIYSLIISPSAHKVVVVQSFMWPWQAIGLAFARVGQIPYKNLIIDLLIAAFFCLLLILSWRKMRKSYRIYTIATVLVSFGYYTGPIYPYMGLPRHLLLSFPVFIALGSVATKPGIHFVLIALSITGFFLLEALYVLNSWIP